jgi:hypothetical protein
VGCKGVGLKILASFLNSLGVGRLLDPSSMYERPTGGCYYQAGYCTPLAASDHIKLCVSRGVVRDARLEPCGAALHRCARVAHVRCGHAGM